MFQLLPLRADKHSVEAHEERRNRLPNDFPVSAAILGTGDESPIHGRVINMSGSGLLLRLPALIPYGSPVKVQAGDLLMLGEVCRCRKEHGEWQVAIEIRHFLDHLAELERLNRAILGSATPDREPQDLSL